jgi:hypothetical protein
MRKSFNVITEEVKLEMYEAYGEVSDRTWADIKTIAQYVPGNAKDVDIKTALCRSMLGVSFTIWTDTPRFVTMEEFVSDKTDSVPLRGLYCGFNTPDSLEGMLTPKLVMDALYSRHTTTTNLSVYVRTNMMDRINNYKASDDAYRDAHAVRNLMSVMNIYVDDLLEQYRNEDLHEIFERHGDDMVSATNEAWETYVKGCREKHRSPRYGQIEYAERVLKEELRYRQLKAQLLKSIKELSV